MSRFQSIFSRTGLATQFAPVVEHTRELRMFSALFIVRTECLATNVHSDWAESVGTNALTLITPLTECAKDETVPGGFNLLYEGEGELRQYQYQPGKAIVFGAGFRRP